MSAGTTPRTCRSRGATAGRRPRLGRGRIAALLQASVACLPGAAGAATPYVQMSVGASVPADVTIASRSDDRASVCDEYINPRATAVPGCTSPGRGAGGGWLAPFDGSRGLSGEAEAGLRLSPRLRIAVGLSYGATDFDQTVSSTDATGVDFDKIDNELSVGEETLGTISSHELFLLAFRDWPNASRWTPYVGVGVGVARRRKDFSWLWARSTDPGDIATGREQPNAAEIRTNLAGTVSAGRQAIRDSLGGYTVSAGIDRAISDKLSVGLKVQWKGFGRFDSGRYQGDLVRSHRPNLRLDGSEPVGTWSTTDDTARLFVTFTVRHSLP